MDKQMQRELTVIVRKRDQKLFEGAASSVTSYNERGTFDILPMHTNFVAVIKQRLEVRPIGGQSIKLDLERGIMYVKENRVEIYVGV